MYTKRKKKETTPERKRKERKANGNHKKLNGEKTQALVGLMKL
jgi:hypothetical protein